MKRLILVLLFIGSSITAQVGVVELENPVYSFLSRMKTLNLISNYDEFELPKTRREVSKYIQSLEQKREELNPVDNKIMDELIVEFYFDIYTSTEKSTQLLPSPEMYEPFSIREKYLYYLAEGNKFNLFTNLIIQNRSIYSKEKDVSGEKVDLFKFGGMIRGSFMNNFGFMIKGTNGTHFGNKALAQQFGSLRYNYKYNYDKLSKGGVDFFDETEGYFLADWDIIRFKIGRDRFNIGYAQEKSLIGSNAPQFDYLSMNINYGIFGFSYFHGKLLGSQLDFPDDTQGTLRYITDKYIVYHRFKFDFNRHIKLGLGEMIIYSNRSIDFSYLNPFNYYKSVEHANKDRDNSLLFFDIQNNTFNGVNLYSTLLIDDIDFGKIGTSHYVNKFMFEVGTKLLPIYNPYPVEVELNYRLVTPYTYAHRIYNNNFTNDGYSLTDQVLPNSVSYFIGVSSQFHHRVKAEINFSYTRHGANTVVDDRVFENYGGDILTGHRVNDPEEVELLEGNLQQFRRLGFNLSIEPVNNYFILINTLYESSNTISKGNSSNFIGSLVFEVRI